MDFSIANPVNLIGYGLGAAMVVGAVAVWLQGRRAARDHARLSAVTVLGGVGRSLDDALRQAEAARKRR